MRTRLFRQKKTGAAAKVVFFVAALIGVIVALNWAIGSFDAGRGEQQLQIAEDAILKASVQCYSIESRYPSSLQYLVDNYGVVLDESKYIYHYRATGSNLLPEVEVFEKSSSYIAFTNEDGKLEIAEGK
jgi:hypothetical protein